ncbi:hypothetical protein D3C75_1250040 [compost metagenome]
MSIATVAIIMTTISTQIISAVTKVMLMQAIPMSMELVRPKCYSLGLQQVRFSWRLQSGLL